MLRLIVLGFLFMAVLLLFCEFVLNTKMNTNIKSAKCRELAKRKGLSLC